jgi:hypothetical protein
MVEVRLTGETEADVRKVAQEMGVTLTRVKRRDDCYHGYGHYIL